MKENANMPTSSRRHFLSLAAAGAGLVVSGRAFGQTAPAAAETAQGAASTRPSGAFIRQNVSGFRRIDWRDHFETLGLATIIADTESKALSFWNADGSDHRVYPIAVPLSEELTKRGYTQVVRKRVGPDWTPTPSMIERNPELKYIPPGPENPLGTHAMYLTWPAYLIHGTHNTMKIGRKSSDGCIGLYNEMVEQLFAVTPVGTQVLIL